MVCYTLRRDIAPDHNTPALKTFFLDDLPTRRKVHFGAFIRHFIVNLYLFCKLCSPTIVLERKHVQKYYKGIIEILVFTFGTLEMYGLHVGNPS